MNFEATMKLFFWDLVLDLVFLVELVVPLHLKHLYLRDLPLFLDSYDWGNRYTGGLRAPFNLA